MGYNADMTDSRLQVELNRDVLAILDALMIETRRVEGNRKIGSGTIAARLIESLAEHPEMIEQLLDEYSKAHSDVQLVAEQHAQNKTEPSPFAGSRSNAKKRKSAA